MVLLKKIINLTGEIINNIKVIEFVKRENNKTIWKCKCHCGKEFFSTTNRLRNKTVMSCGCMRGGAGKTKNSKTNIWNFEENIAIGTTNKKEKFIIDIEDYEKVKNFCWRIDKFGYVVANSKNFLNLVIKLHKIITNSNKDEIIDHINQDKKDNRKSNLRKATKSQNNSNIKRRSDNTSGYTGVKFENKTNKWKAQISLNNNRYHLGTFDTKEDAIIARNKAEIEIHKEFNGEIVRNDFTKVLDIEEAESIE